MAPATSASNMLITEFTRPAVDDNEAFVMATINRLRLSRIFVRACQQIILIKSKLRGLSARFKIAKRRRQNSLMRSLALRIDVTEGMRSMMYEYAREIADNLSDAYWRLNSQVVIFCVDFDVEDNNRSDEESDDDNDAEVELQYDSLRI